MHALEWYPAILGVPRVKGVPSQANHGAIPHGGPQAWPPSSHLGRAVPRLPPRWLSPKWSPRAVPRPLPQAPPNASCPPDGNGKCTLRSGTWSRLRKSSPLLPHGCCRLVFPFPQGAQVYGQPFNAQTHSHVPVTHVRHQMANSLGRSLGGNSYKCPQQALGYIQYGIHTLAAAAVRDDAGFTGTSLHGELA